MEKNIVLSAKERNMHANVNKMKFEEQFPSAEIEFNKLMNDVVLDETMLQSYERRFSNFQKAIQKHCLDKEIVKDCIQFWTSDIRSKKTQKFIREKILKELGLE